MSSAPPPDPSDLLEGNLGDLSDEDWLEAHLSLAATGAIPAEELRFLYDPSTPSSRVTAADLTDDGRPRRG